MKDPAAPRKFATTQWSLVLAARPGAASEASARRALEELCRAYWYPLYAFVRYRGCSADVRYVSDSSYRLYLVHLPLIIVAQVLIRDVDLPAGAKLALLVAGATLLLLASYRLFVRDTWVGRLLNGPPRRRRIGDSAAREASLARC